MRQLLVSWVHVLIYNLDGLNQRLYEPTESLTNSLSVEQLPNATPGFLFKENICLFIYVDFTGPKSLLFSAM